MLTQQTAFLSKGSNQTTTRWYFCQQNCLLTRQHEPLMMHSATRGFEQDAESNAHKDTDAYYNLHYLWVVETECQTVISEDNGKNPAEKYPGLHQLSTKYVTEIHVIHILMYCQQSETVNRKLNASSARRIYMLVCNMYRYITISKIFF